MTFSVLVNTHCTLSGSQELTFGLRRLQQFCAASPGFCGWHSFTTKDGLEHLQTHLQVLATDEVLLILNPALVTTADFVNAMRRVLNQHPEQVVLPADPRNAQAPWNIDYASRAGLERYVARRKALPEYAPSERITPWVVLARREVLVAHLNDLTRNAIVAQHAFVHSFADYQSSDRRDILDLVPNDVKHLMDVGGGEGWFLSGFQKTRDTTSGLLVEPSKASALAAKARGLSVVNRRFEEVNADLYGHFDCISFLDVLEHLEDPLAALAHAKTLLKPSGSVLLSVPNVGHWSVVEDLLEGRFDYLPLGILCYTHLRFYTEASLRELLSDVGLRVVVWRNQPSPMPDRLRSALQCMQVEGIRLKLASLETDAFHVLAEMN